LAGGCWLAVSGVATAQAPPPPAGGSNEELAKKLANPVANLISVPFQLNYDHGFGPREAGHYTLNVQPVVPFTLDDDWNLITRTIMPAVYQESSAAGVSSEFGLADFTQSFFLSPTHPVGGWVMGFGPVLRWPTATDDALGSEKWGAGPTFVGAKQHGPWTFGILANHIWSYAGDDDRTDVDATFLQPFVSHT
jgi:hypothetical protein